MKFKLMRWLGPVRELPGYGTIQPGEKKRVPASVANSYINQGLAAEVDTRKKEAKS